ncbi:DNA adenine methylase, partial [Paenibacillus sp. AK121]|uniref:DNA adenine methylase n=1 Tax=Paenibacillus sp. AK121 TaxID=2849670 RepID=UPI001C250136
MEMEGSLDLSAYERPHVQDMASPFRYPGGKGFLTGYLGSKLSEIKAGERHYAEPFCGGAGAALNLLKSGVADVIHLNDADIRVYSAWRAMLFETDRFLDRLRDAKVDMEEWDRSIDLVQNADNSKDYSFDLGFATYFINRTSRSGIILGAGPIGGYAQTGRWKIDARWYRETMSARIRWLGSARDRVRLTNEDALTFMARSRTRLPLDDCLIFVDPPYVQVGSRLYLSAMNEAKDSALAD